MKDQVYTTFSSMREMNDNEKIRDEFLTIVLRMSTDEVTTSRKY